MTENNPNTDASAADEQDSIADGGSRSAEESERPEMDEDFDSIVEFLEGKEMFKGPDQEIMQDHTMAPRTELEETGLKAIEGDETTRMVLMNRLQSITNEAREMVQQIAYSPGAKWGDLITCLFTREGDMAVAASSGVLLFVALQSHPIKHLMKKWRENPDYEINRGDVFHHNDARYGNVHNTDQSTILPIFDDDDELVAWASCVVHEGENGATEPGGMPGDAESPYDEGLKIQPMKIGERYELDDELITYFQNSARDKKLIKNGHRARLSGAKRMVHRVEEAMSEYGSDAVVGTLRHALESPAEEARERIQNIPDGTYNHTIFVDNTLKDDCLIKIPLTVEIDGGEIRLDYAGAAPEFDDRAINTVFASLKGMLGMVFLNFIWPDFPRNQAALEPITIEADHGSVLNCRREVPNAQSMMTFLPTFSTLDSIMMKALYPDFVQGNQAEATTIHSNRYNLPVTYSYGGMTQHGDFVGNILTDLNTAPGGARLSRDGLHSQAGIFCAMGDMGETEQYEEEYPFVGLTRARIMKDVEGFGRYRSGHGHQQMFTHKDTPAWAWLATATGSRFPTVMGLYGGYGAPTIPIGRVRGADAFEVMSEDPDKLAYDIPELMQEQPLDGEYSTWDLGLQMEYAEEGDIYWLTQGAGGGLGDPIERDPEAVLEDVQDDIISDWVVENIYRVAYDNAQMAVDEEQTEALRSEERERRLDEGIPFDQFVDEWQTETPPDHIPFFGSWDDESDIYAGVSEAPMSSEALQPVNMELLRTEHPTLFDTPVYPPSPEYAGDVAQAQEDADGNADVGGSDSTTEETSTD